MTLEHQQHVSGYCANCRYLTLALTAPKFLFIVGGVCVRDQPVLLFIRASFECAIVRSRRVGERILLTTDSSVSAWLGCPSSPCDGWRDGRTGGGVLPEHPRQPRRHQ